MKFLFFLLVLSGLNLTVFAQTQAVDSSNTYSFVGLDLGKTIFANIWQPSSSGFTIEGIFRKGRRDPDRVGLGYVFSAGYSRFKQDSVYQNTNYTCEGYFGKAGFELSFWTDNRPIQNVFYGFGLNLVLAQVRNYGNFKIPGDYFSDFEMPFDKNRFLSGIQFHAQVIYPLIKGLSLGFNTNLAYLINPPPKNSLNSISYYSPGMGITRNNRLGGGVGFQIFYQIN